MKISPKTFQSSLKAQAFYRSGEFDRAEAQFRRALELNPMDKVSAVFLERCEYLKAHSDGHWDGVWVMKSK